MKPLHHRHLWILQSGKTVVAVWHFTQYRHGMQINSVGKNSGSNHYIRTYMIYPCSFSYSPPTHTFRKVIAAAVCQSCYCITSWLFNRKISVLQFCWFRAENSVIILSANTFTPLILLLLLKSSFTHDSVCNGVLLVCPQFFISI